MMMLSEAKIAVIGLGYVGLPLAVEFGGDSGNWLILRAQDSSAKARERQYFEYPRTASAGQKPIIFKFC